MILQEIDLTYFPAVNLNALAFVLLKGCLTQIYFSVTVNNLNFKAHVLDSTLSCNSFS